MKNLEDITRTEFFTISGKAELSTLVASALGINFGMVKVAEAALGKVSPFRFAILRGI
jgi:hypothetical protein